MSLDGVLRPPLHYEAQLRKLLTVDVFEAPADIVLHELALWVMFKTSRRSMSCRLARPIGASKARVGLSLRKGLSLAVVRLGQHSCGWRSILLPVFIMV